MTRFGLAAKGVVNVLIGTLALLAAIGEGGETVDTRGAVSSIARQPFGEIALLVIGAGLLGYAGWRVACAFRDTEREGSDAKGMGKRVFYFVVALVYASTALFAFRLALGDSPQQDGDAAQSWTARLLNAPLGMFLVVAVGLGIMAGGVAQLITGWKEKFRKNLRSLPANHDWVIRAGKWGHIARGVVFLIIGGFVVLAALRHDASEVRGIEGALDTLAAQPYGQLLLAVVAAGLTCYGAYSLVEAKYRAV